MQYAEQMLAPLAADRDALRRHMADKVAETDAPPPAASNGWAYDAQRPAGHTHRVFSRRAPDGATQTLFDEADRARGYAYYRATAHQASPADRSFSWAEDIAGDDRHRIWVRDMASGLIR